MSKVPQIYYMIDNDDTNDMTLIFNYTDLLREITFRDFMKIKEEKSAKQNDKSNWHKKYSMVKTPTFKDLLLLTPNITSEWSKIWIQDMLVMPDYYAIKLNEMLKMGNFAKANSSNRYFYIGYFPSDFDTKKNGPLYIGAFELSPKIRNLQLYMIIQNPNYYNEKYFKNIYNNNKKHLNSNKLNGIMLNRFKREIMGLCLDWSVTLKYDSLLEKRYYLDWIYNI